MRNLFSVVLFLSLLTACSNKQNTDNRTVEFVSQTSSPQTYSADNISDFFKQVLQLHNPEIKHIYAADFSKAASQLNFMTDDFANQNTFNTFQVIHDFLTSKDATNCSRGEILNIPYLWHWVDPNPRNEIYSVSQNKKLNTIQPPVAFSKYNNYAEIDRTPFLFLSELFSSDPLYYSAACDTFSSFGWCSEREMAYVCLMDILGYKGKIVAEENHSWSEFRVPMSVPGDSLRHFKVKIDNTFDKVEWSQFVEDFNSWENYLGNAKEAQWYNNKAHDEVEKNELGNFKPSQQALVRLEAHLVEYLNNKLNQIE